MVSSRAEQDNRTLSMNINYNLPGLMSYFMIDKFDDGK